MVVNTSTASCGHRPVAWLSQSWSQLVEELIPLGIAQLCFFDAEKIRFLAEDETSMTALGDAIKSLLGLDLAERLVADAAVLEGRLAKRAEASAELADVRDLEQTLQERQTEIDALVREMGSLENHRQLAKTRVGEVEDQFAKVGGRHWEQRESLLGRQGEWKESVRETESRLAGLATTDLPLALVPDLLAAVQRQAAAERDAAETEVVARLLAERDAELLALLQKKRAGQRLAGRLGQKHEDASGSIFLPHFSDRFPIRRVPRTSPVRQLRYALWCTSTRRGRCIMISGWSGAASCEVGGFLWAAKIRPVLC